MERYAVTIDKNSLIKNDPNDWGKEHGNPRYILNLMLSVINVSVKTMQIVNALPILTFEGDKVIVEKSTAEMPKEEKAKEGTPLNQFAFLTVPELDLCETKGIFTVEDLSNITKEQAQDMNLTTAKELAIKFLQMAKDNKAIAKFENEIKALKAENEKLRDEIKALKGE
jgi:hypothetical protein